jgi:hypothetical protein
MEVFAKIPDPKRSIVEIIESNLGKFESFTTREEAEKDARENNVNYIIEVKEDRNVIHIIEDIHHKTKNIQIGNSAKYAEVDELIIPLVKWLNSFSGVETLYSCQGDLDFVGIIKRQPYVGFVCNDTESLRIIELEFTKSDIKVESIDSTFIIYFNNQKDMIDFCNQEFINNHEKETQP